MHEELPSRLHRWCARLLDGENRWGFVRVQIDRFGVTRYRLVVYPPGISDDERRRLRTWRGSPVWGASLWVVTEILLSPVLGPRAALAISTCLALGLVAVALVRADETRTRVRAMGAVTMAGHTDAAMIAARDKLETLAMTLLFADERVDEEHMSPLDHEAIWWRVYEQLAPAGAAANARKMSQ
jgi:hypothetical protein